MADIRINSLPTTASASSSDDFLALDGATNGTRKLNAYSPTFGGNLTVSGTGGGTFTGPVTFGSPTNIGSASAVWMGGNGSSGAFFNVPTGANIQLGINNSGLVSITSTATTLQNNLTVSGTGTSSFASGSKLGVGTTSPGVTFVAVGAPATLNYTIGSTSLADIRSTSAAATNAGPSLTFSGYYQTSLNTSTYGAIKGVLLGAGDGNSAAGALTFLTANTGGVLSEQARLTNSGNLLIGTTSDGGQKLQVAGTVYFSGDLYSNTAGSTWGADSGATGFLVYGAGGGGNANKLVLRTNSSTALTLDSSQNATFAGKITANGASVVSTLSASGTTVTGFDVTNGAAAAVNNATRVIFRNNNAFSGAYVSGEIKSVTPAANNTSNLVFSAYEKDNGLLTALTLTPSGTSVSAAFNGAISINNTVQTAVAVASTHKVTIVIGGVTYYLLATNV